MDWRPSPPGRGMVGHTPDVLPRPPPDMAWALLARRAAEDPGGRTTYWEVLGDGSDLLLGNDLWGTTLGIVGMDGSEQTVADGPGDSLY